MKHPNKFIEGYMEMMKAAGVPEEAAHEALALGMAYKEAQRSPEVLAKIDRYLGALKLGQAPLDSATAGATNRSAAARNISGPTRRLPARPAFRDIRDIFSRRNDMEYPRPAPMPTRRFPFGEGGTPAPMPSAPPGMINPSVPPPAPMPDRPPTSPTASNILERLRSMSHPGLARTVTGGGQQLQSQ